MRRTRAVGNETLRRRGTACGSGASTRPDTGAAVAEAVRQALSGLGERRASLGLLFVAPDRDLTTALATARLHAAGTDFMACSTAGELTERGLTHGGVACLLVAWDESEHLSAFLPALDGDALELAERLCTGFQDTLDRSAAAGRSHSITVLFGDGLNPMFEKLVVQLRLATTPTQQIVGAGAADEGRLVSTRVGARGRALEGGAVAFHVFSRARWGVGVAHGVTPTTEPMTVTRAVGNVVHEIDGEPALDAYRRYAEDRGVTLDDQNAPQFLVENALGVLLFDDIVRIRTPIRLEPAERALVFAGEMPEGSRVRVVRGEPEQILDAAREAARAAAEGLDGARAAGVLVFSCICRALRLGERYGEEIACVREVFPDVPIAGFSSYGEIARTAAKLDGYHNSTIVVAAIPE